MIFIEYRCPKCFKRSKMEIMNILTLIDWIGAYTCNYCKKVAFNQYDFKTLANLVKMDSDKSYDFARDTDALDEMYERANDHTADDRL